MKAKTLRPGGMIGICSPSHIADYWDYQNTINAIRSKGFQVREADNLYKNTYGYAATPQERAADFNQLIADPEIELVLFGGGEGANELLPYIDFENIKRNPKRIMSYSDGTFILNPIWAQTGLETYYGQAPHNFLDMTWYDEKYFFEHMVYDCMQEHLAGSEWKVQTYGRAEGILIGGYARNFAMILGSKYLPLDYSEKYVLFIEDHESFGGVDYVSAMLTHVEQDRFMDSVAGVIFGNYSGNEHPELLWRLKRLGEERQIPVVYCDDFGHGWNHAIMPIGRRVCLDTEEKRLMYL
ncbi:MAG: LD-carboxypeptidase [Dorea sp.]